jgi:hypothetical protein
MAFIVDNICDLIEICKSRSANIIALDGYQGAGKTTLARYISNKLNYKLVSLDDYFIPAEKSYLSSLDYSNLRIELSHQRVVVEGVCLGAALGFLSLSPDLVIYIFSPKPDRNSPRGWGRLAVEVSRYHELYDPENNAHIIYIAPDIPKEMYVMSSDRTQIDIAYIKSKTAISIVLGFGGMLTLVIGLTVLLWGISGNDETIIKTFSLEVSAKGLGAVIMATSIIWAFFAYRARPSYSHSRESSEKFDSKSNLLERFEREASTTLADPSQRPRRN